MNGDLVRLTQRELQVAALVASGLTDREIAERLLVTRRTAEWHVEQILAKCGLKSRSQIAAMIAQTASLGISPYDANALRPQLPGQTAAFLGYKAEFSQRFELLQTTRMLARSPGDETDAQRQERLKSLAEAGYNPVIAGFVYAKALARVAPDFPATQFAIVDDSSLSSLNPNVTSMVFADNEGSYLVGAIAAQASSKGVLGFIGGVHVPFIAGFEAGYVAGATAVKAGIKVMVKYLSDPPDYSGFMEPAKARAAATAMFKAGAGVVYHAAGGAGLGVFQAARAEGGLAVGVDSDQYLTAPTETRSSILTSMLKRVDDGVQWFVRRVAEKASIPGVVRFDLANDGVGYSRSNPLVLPHVALADRLREQIIAGRIRVPVKP